MSVPIYFSASQVAALIGKHRYQTQSYALLCAANANQNLRTKTLCDNLKSRNEVVRDAILITKREKMVLEELKDVKLAVQESAKQKTVSDDLKIADLVQIAIAKTAEIDEKIAHSELILNEELLKSAEILAKKEEDAHIEAILRTSKALAAAKNSQTPDCKVSLNEMYEMASAVVNSSTRQIHTEASQILIEEAEKIDLAVTVVALAAKEMSLKRHDELSEECKESAKRESEKIAQFEAKKRVVQLVAKPEAMKELVEEAVQKKRGREEEDEVINDAEKRLNIKVSDRNTKSGSLRGENYLVLGRVDGISDEDIVEIKTRKNWFSVPPEYDLVQLRVYLRMFRKAKGLLIEENRDRGLTRETRLENCDNAWESIDRALISSANLLHNCSEDDIIRWSVNVLAKK